jgi:hypothetical protein
MEFWNEFLKIEQLIVYNIRMGTSEGQGQALAGVETVGKMTGFPLTFQLGIDMRNGKKFPERKDTLELVISPNWNRSKVSLVKELYETSKKANLPKYWSIVKYQVFSPTIVHDIDVQGVTHEDFTYCAQLNFEGNSAWMGVLIFINDKLAKEILTLKKEGKTPEDNEWELDGKTPKGRSPLMFLNSAVGEYNMITRIKAVEFVPRSSHGTVPQYAMTDLHQEFEKMDRQDYGNGMIHECVRCGIYSYQADVFPCGKCKKIYYCSKMCQKADSENHSFVCKD